MYDEVWAVDAERVKTFFRDEPDDVAVISLPDRTLGSMTMPQTRIIITGDNADELYRRFYLSFMTALPMVFLNHKLEYEYPYHVCIAQTVKMKSANFVDSRDLHRQMISNGIACGFVPEGNAEIYRNDSRIKLLHLTDDRFTRQMKACFKREKHLSVLGGAFRKAMIEYFNLQSE